MGDISTMIFETFRLSTFCKKNSGLRFMTRLFDVGSCLNVVLIKLLRLILFWVFV